MRNYMNIDSIENLFIKFWRELLDLGVDDDSKLLEKYIEILHKYSNSKGSIFYQRIDHITVRNIISHPKEFNIDLEEEFFYIFDSKNKIEILEAENFGFTGNLSLIILPILSGEKASAFVLLIEKESISKDFLFFLDNANAALAQRFIANRMLEDIALKKHQSNIIMQTIPEAVIYFEENGNFVWLNNLAKNLLKIEGEFLKPDIVSSAMIRLRNAAINSDEINQVGNRIFQEGNSEIKNWYWIYGEPVDLVYQVSVFKTAYKNSNGQIWVFTDITNRYLANERLLELNKEIKEKIILAENANNAKSTFLANMSHELRTPLNSILGFSQILLQSNEINNNDKEHIRFIQKSGEHLLSLINDVLDLSKIEAGKFELQFSIFSLHSLIFTIGKMLEIKAIEKGLGFEVIISPNTPSFVIFDERKLKQVLLNVLSNAIKYTDKGEVVLSLNLIRQEGNKARISFSIQDTGRGIAKSDIESIFMPFQQITTNSQYVQGTGLGLSITKSLVEAMGSEIKVESELGKGSQFSFEIEFEIPENNQEEAISFDEVIGYKGNRKKILIVDDNIMNRILFERMLRGIGFLIEHGESGKDALSKIDIFFPDLIFIDLRMPGISGLDLIKIIKDNPKYKDIKLIATSASAFNETRNKCIEAGADDFIIKPIQFSELITKITPCLKIEWIIIESKHPQVEDNKNIPLSIDKNLLNQLLDSAKQGEIATIETNLKFLKEKYPDQNPIWEKFEKYTNHFEINLLIESLNQLIGE